MFNFATSIYKHYLVNKSYLTAIIDIENSQNGSEMLIFFKLYRLEGKHFREVFVCSSHELAKSSYFLNNILLKRKYNMVTLLPIVFGIGKTTQFNQSIKKK